MLQDPYSEIAEMMRSAGRLPSLALPVHIRLGKVLSVKPLRLDVAGTVQEGDRVYISHRLTEGHRERMTLECTGITATLPASIQYPGGTKAGCSAAVSGASVTGSFTAGAFAVEDVPEIPDPVGASAGNVSAAFSGTLPEDVAYPGGTKGGCTVYASGGTGEGFGHGSGTMKTPDCWATQAEPVLEAGDTVLLTDDDQIFYLVDKVVKAG